MKKFLTFFLTALLAFSVGWAADVTINMSQQGWNNAQDVTSVSSGDVSISFDKGTNSSNGPKYYNTGSGVRLYAGNTMTITANNNTITDISITFSGSYTGGYVSDVGNYSTSGSTGTWSGSATSVTFTAASTSRMQTVTVTYSSGGSTTVTPPTISPEGGEFLNSQVVTLSHVDADAIYYTLDGTDPTTSSTLYNGPFTLNATTTVKAIAEKDGVTSSVATAIFTKITGVADIAEALTQTGQFTFAGAATVVYQSEDNKYLYIKDGSGWGLVYDNAGTAFGTTFTNGNILDAGWKASNTTYNGLPEFNNPVAGTFTSTSSGTAVEPVALTTINGDTPLNMYATMNNLTVSSVSNDGKTIYLDGVSFVLRKQFNVTGLPTFTAEKTYNVRGFVGVYNGTYQLYPIWAEEVVSSDPTITLDPPSLTIDDSGTNNSFTVTARNLHENDYGNVSVAHNWVFNTTLTSSTNSIANWNGLQGFNRNNGSVDGTVTVTYTGRELTATDTYTIGTEGASKTITVTYEPNLYIYCDNGVSPWNFQANPAIAMTNNGEGIYTATLNDIPANSHILFGRASGLTYTWDGDDNRLFMGAVMDNGQDWQYGYNEQPGSIDTNPTNPVKYRPIWFPEAGTYTVTINANNRTFTITKEVVLTGDFTLVTDASQLAEGDEVIIANTTVTGTARAMGERNSNNNNYYGTEVTVTASKTIPETSDMQIFTLESGTGGWYFKTSDNLYLTSTTGSNNNLQTKAKDGNGANTSLATISIEYTAAVIRFQGTGSRKYLRYNKGQLATGGYDYFSCYTETSQANVYLYHRSAQMASLSADKQHITLVTPADQTQSEPQTFTVTGSNLTENVTITVDNANFVLNPISIVPAGGAVSQEVTVTYVGESVTTENATVTITSSGKTVVVYVHGRKEASTTLAEIEQSSNEGDPVVVSDELIGAWAYGTKLWAKDQNNASIDKRMAATGQMDYLQQEIWHDQENNVYHLQTGAWDESNWVILDFSNLRSETTAAACVGKKLTNVKGIYSNDENYTITLTDPVTATEDADAASLYPGYQQEVAMHINPYEMGYNSYIPANFYESNWNGVDAINSNTYVDNQNHDEVISLYFMNPKVQEVARIWGVWNGNGGFAVYGEGFYNRFGIHGAVNVGGWDYNYIGMATDLVKDQAYLFHAVVAKPATTGRAAAPAASNDAASTTLVIYPLDLSAQGSATAVKDVVGDRVVKSVSYYNIMGVESAQPFQGVNIVVTRYTDGSTSTAKVMF